MQTWGCHRCLQLAAAVQLPGLLPFLENTVHSLECSGLSFLVVLGLQDMMSSHPATSHDEIVVGCACMSYWTLSIFYLPYSEGLAEIYLPLIFRKI